MEECKPLAAGQSEHCWGEVDWGLQRALPAPTAGAQRCATAAMPHSLSHQDMAGPYPHLGQGGSLVPPHTR